MAEVVPGGYIPESLLQCEEGGLDLGGQEEAPASEDEVPLREAGHVLVCDLRLLEPGHVLAQTLGDPLLHGVAVAAPEEPPLVNEVQLCEEFLAVEEGEELGEAAEPEGDALVDGVVVAAGPLLLLGVALLQEPLLLLRTVELAHAVLLLQDVRGRRVCSYAGAEVDAHAEALARAALLQIPAEECGQTLPEILGTKPVHEASEEFVQPLSLLVAAHELVGLVAAAVCSEYLFQCGARCNGA